MRYLLDTNICIYIIKRKPEQVLAKFKQLEPGDVCLSSISLAELDYGVHKSQHAYRNQIALKEFTMPLDILPFDEEAAMHYGKLRYDLEKQGQPIGSMDLLIAAHALSKQITLVSNNLKEFQKIPQLKLENWAYNKEIA